MTVRKLLHEAKMLREYSQKIHKVKIPMIRNKELTDMLYIYMADMADARHKLEEKIERETEKYTAVKVKLKTKLGPIPSAMYREAENED